MYPSRARQAVNLNLRGLKWLPPAAGAGVLLLFLAQAVAQQPKDWFNLPPPSPAVESGEKLFVTNCSFCHGRDGAGKSGPDLLRSMLVNRDQDGKQIGVIVHNGRPATGMPAFPSLTDSEVSDIAAFLHYRTQAVVARGSYVIQDLVTGDPKAGEAYFNGTGGCNGCHSPSGDLSGIAGKFQPAQLQHLFLAGREQGKHVPVQAKVTLPSGQSISGTLEHLDEFDVALLDSSGEYRSWSREGVQVELHDPLAAHRELLRKYTDADIHNILAYLETLK
jgi:cytochrome c oxidase cbb3-type subunit 3